MVTPDVSDISPNTAYLTYCHARSRFIVYTRFKGVIAMIFNYIRVSTGDQNSARQMAEVKADRVYKEVASAKSKNRPQLTAMLSNLRKGDVVNVHELSRLARSVRDLIEIVESILSSGASIVFQKENLKFEAGEKQDAFQNLSLNLLGAVAQFERELLLERQREGIAIAKGQGKYKGRRTKFTDKDIEKMRNEFFHASNKTQLAKKWGISRQYLYQIAS